MDCTRMSSVDVGVIGAKGRDFELEIAFHYDNHAKVCADRISARKKLLHFFGSRVSGDVEVFRRNPADDVAHATAGEVGNVTGRTYTDGDLASALFHWRR